MACVQGTWWGVGGGMSGGWGGLVLVLVFWVEAGFGVGVSGGWRCLAGGSRFLGGGWCDVWGAVPLRPLLNSPLRAAWCAVVLGSGRPSVWRVLLFVGGCLVGCGSFLRGWAGLAGGLSCWLCSGWVVLNLGSWLLFSWAVQVRPCVCWGCFVVAGSVGCVLVGGLFFCLLCCSRWVGRPGRSGSSSPPLSPPPYTMELPRPPDSVGELTR